MRLNPFRKSVEKMAISPAEMTFNPPGSSWVAVPGTKIDYAAEVQNPLMNSAVSAAVQWVMRSFPESPLEVWEEDESGELSIINPHEMSALIKKPTEFHSGTLLWMATIAEFLVTGNAYWLKVKNGGGKPVQLWPVPSNMMTPKAPSGPSNVFIDHYEYTPGGRAIRIEVEDVVHLRYGIDPMNMRKGHSPLASLLREIFTDNEASNYTASLLRNYGMPSVMFSPEDGSTLPEDARRELEEKWDKKFGGDNVGGVLVSSKGAKITPVGFSPAEMDLGKLRYVPEERIAAVLGIPAAVLGLGTGLETTKVGATLREYREQAWENAIIPMQRLIAEQVQNQLAPDFKSENATIAFDLRHVRVLQDDEDRKFRRVDTAVRGGWLKVTDAQGMVGVPVDDSQDGYLRNVINTSLVRSGEDPVLMTPAERRARDDERVATDFEDDEEDELEELGVGDEDDKAWKIPTEV